MTNEHLYAQVVEELRVHGPIPGLWAKAYSEANGNKPQAEALYFRYRVGQLEQAERQAASKSNQSNDDLENLYSEFLKNFSEHAPYLIIIIGGCAALIYHYFNN